MNKKITILGGDGIGPEVTQQAVKIMHAVGRVFGHQFDTINALMGACAIDATGSPLPAETLQQCMDSDAIILGAIGSPKYDQDPSAKVRPEQGLLQLRKSLGLFANLRPVKTYPALFRLAPLKPNLLEKVDMLIYRELTGGLYFGDKETSEDGNVSKDTCTYSRAEIERVSHRAFKSAMNRRKKVTLVDKANVLETSRLWRKVVAEVAAGYPEVAYNQMFVDNASMQLILQPSQFDVLLTENLFGDILSDEAAVLPGSIGLLPSASLGEHAALFEPIHGSYPQAAGKDIANPVGAILSVAMMMEHFGLHEESIAVRDAVEWSIQHGFVTKDIDPINNYNTSVIGDLMSDFIEGRLPHSVNKKHLEISRSTII